MVVTMTEEQIEEIELILNGSFIEENNRKYSFEIPSVENAEIIFDTRFGLVDIKIVSSIVESASFSREELQNIAKACDEVLEW